MIETENKLNIIVRRVSDRCEPAQKARELLQAAHDACYKSKDRDITGMSSGPFSGVNQVLGMIAEMDAVIVALDKELTSARSELSKIGTSH